MRGCGRLESRAGRVAPGHVGGVGDSWAGLGEFGIEPAPPLVHPRFHDHVVVVPSVDEVPGEPTRERAGTSWARNAATQSSAWSRQQPCTRAVISRGTLNGA
jgi:hypothetical protein